MRSYEINKATEKTHFDELCPQYRATCFEEVARGYKESEAITEARRCIQCPKRPCVSGCPVGVPIPQFLEQVALGNFARAFALVKSANALPAICGRVCPQETQCEGKCNKGLRGEPVAIGRLERFVADWAFAHPEEAASAVDELAAEAAQEAAAQEAAAQGAQETAAQAAQEVAAASAEARGAVANDGNGAEMCGAEVCAACEPVHEPDLSGKRVACVGSGPASLTCAGELAKWGAEVTVFEALHKTGGVLIYGIPEFRLPKTLVAAEIAQLEALGVKFEVNSVIGQLFTVNELIEEKGFDAVFVATGAGLPNYMHIPGEGLNGVVMANELLTRVNLMKAYKFPEYDTPVYAGKKCVVVGGGNVAMDAARTALRLGSEVTVVYRRSRNEMPARAEEIHHAEEEGVKFMMLTNPVACIGDEKGWIKGVECMPYKLGEPDESGRCKPVPSGEPNFVLEADMFVEAIGNSTNTLIAQTTPGLQMTKKNLIVVDEATGATSVPGVFAGGDSVIGAATVILAMGAGKRAAHGIATYLTTSR